MDENADKTALIAALVEEAGSGEGDHPESDALLAYHAGDLDTGAEQRIQNHLVACRDCSQRLLDLLALEPEPAATDAPADLVAAAGWRQLQARLADGEEARRRPAARRWMTAAAAIFLVAALGLGLWNVRLAGTVARLSGPQANVPVAYLDFSTDARSPAAPSVDLDPEEQRFLIFVTPDVDESGFAEYELVMVDAGDSEVVRQRGLRLSENGTLRVLLPALAAGDYLLRLSGFEGERSVALSEHPLTILHRPP